MSERLPIGAYVASALMDAKIESDSGEDVDRFMAALVDRGCWIVDELTIARLLHEASHGYRLPTLTCMTTHRRKARRAIDALREGADVS